MKVSFFGSVQQYTSGKESFEMEAALNIRELISLLGEVFGSVFLEFLYGDKTCVILVNGKGIMTTGGLDTPLHAADSIEVLPFVDGG